jgi:hypothetical protein
VAAEPNQARDGAEGAAAEPEQALEDLDAELPQAAPPVQQQRRRLIRRVGQSSSGGVASRACTSSFADAEGVAPSHPL